MERSGVRGLGFESLGQFGSLATPKSRNDKRGLSNISWRALHGSRSGVYLNPQKYVK